MAFPESIQDQSPRAVISFPHPARFAMERFPRPFLNSFSLTRDPDRGQRIDGKVRVHRARTRGQTEHGIELIIISDEGLRVVSQEELEKGKLTDRLKKRISSTYPLLWIGEGYLELAFESKENGTANLIVSSPTQITLEEI